MKLPLFPLQSVFYPGETVPLHIFEERYKQLINDCRKEALTFGIPVFIDNGIKFGTEVQLVPFHDPCRMGHTLRLWVQVVRGRLLACCAGGGAAGCDPVPLFPMPRRYEPLGTRKRQPRCAALHLGGAGVCARVCLVASVWFAREHARIPPPMDAKTQE